MIFKTKIKADILKRFIGITSSLVDDAKFKIMLDGVSMRVVDSAHVAMADINVKKTVFEEYEADEAELGLDVSKFNDVLKLVDKNDIVSLEYEEPSNRLVVKVGNLVRKMGLIDMADMSDSKMPSLVLPARIVVKAGELRNGVRASEMISDHLVLVADEDVFELSATGDTDEVSLKLTRDLLSELKSEGRFKSLYSIDYFSNMIKMVKDDELITVLMGNDNPAQLDFDFTADKGGHVTYLLAPRIESE